MRSANLLVIYYSLFYSLITYGIIVWGGAWENNLHLIQAIQNKMLKK